MLEKRPRVITKRNLCAVCLEAHIPLQTAEGTARTERVYEYKSKRGPYQKTQQSVVCESLNHYSSSAYNAQVDTCRNDSERQGLCSLRATECPVARRQTPAQCHRSPLGTPSTTPQH
jgi:hypothetical protein